MIPNRYHFVWFGPEFPFTHALAVRSIAKTSSPEAIILHATDDLRGQPHFDALVRDVPSFVVRRVDLDALFGDRELPNSERLRRVWDDLTAKRRWAALSDILRYLVLFLEGGVYLDLDTITLRDLRPLLAEPGFCGREHLLVNAAAYRRNSSWRYFRTGPLSALRWICSRTDAGIRMFHRVSACYPMAINGAVLGLPARHPVAREALARVPDLVPELERRRPIIGPDLLQDLIDGERRSDVTVFDPSYFYPLGPEMAAQLFRMRRSAREIDRALADAISPQTFVVHWYNDNLKLLPRPPDLESITATADRQMFARLALPVLTGTAA